MLADVITFLDSGGPVLYGILLVALLMWGIILDRYWFFTREARPYCQAQRKIWLSTENKQQWKGLKIRQLLISQVSLEFQRYRPVLHLLVVICPLMGLLGTVTGMIRVFDLMSITGTGNARAMASGISMATIPTMAGMVVSLIGLYFKSRFDSMAKKELDIFQDRLVKQ